jgi:hypothetical protein
MSYDPRMLAATAATLFLVLSAIASVAQSHPHPVAAGAVTAHSTGWNRPGTILADATTVTPGGIGWD